MPEKDKGKKESRKDFDNMLKRIVRVPKPDKQGKKNWKEDKE